MSRTRRARPIPARGRAGRRRGSATAEQTVQQPTEQVVVVAVLVVAAVPSVVVAVVVAVAVAVVVAVATSAVVTAVVTGVGDARCAEDSYGGDCCRGGGDATSAGHGDAPRAGGLPGLPGGAACGMRSCLGQRGTTGEMSGGTGRGLGRPSGRGEWRAPRRRSLCRYHSPSLRPGQGVRRTPSPDRGQAPADLAVQRVGGPGG